MLKHILKKLPESSRVKLVRTQFQIPDKALDADFTVKIANTREELESAYRLLHDAYVGQKLMEPHPSGLRCSIYSLLPETATIIVKYKNATVGTVSLIKDSPMGLPCDENYRDENDKLRAKGAKLIEVSSLAVDKNFRAKGHAVQLLLMKHLYHYSLLMGGDHLAITIHPRARYFYEGLLSFSKAGEVIQYKMVNGALASYMWMPTQSISHWTKLSASFKSDNFKNNMAMWLLNYMDERFIFPKLQVGQILTPVLTPDLMEYFFVHKTNLLEELSIEKRKVFFEILIHFFGEKEIERFQKYYSTHELREYRLAVSLNAGLEIQNEFFIVNISDLSSNGAFIELSSKDCLPIRKGDHITLRFRIGSRSYQVQSQVMWIRKQADQQGPVGFGVKFAETIASIGQELRMFSEFQEKAA